jgi:hypothetical protein
LTEASHRALAAAKAFDRVNLIDGFVSAQDTVRSIGIAFRD